MRNECRLARAFQRCHVFPCDIARGMKTNAASSGKQEQFNLRARKGRRMNGSFLKFRPLVIPTRGSFRSCSACTSPDCKQIFVNYLRDPYAEYEILAILMTDGQYYFLFLFVGLGWNFAKRDSASWLSRNWGETKSETWRGVPGDANYLRRLAHAQKKTALFSRRLALAPIPNNWWDIVTFLK